MLSHRTVECLIALLVVALLGGCVAQRPVEETAVATRMVGPRPEQTPTTTPAPTNTPLPMPTATAMPAYTTTAAATPIPMIPTLTPSPTPRFTPLPTSPSPATPLPPVPVFAGLLRHDLQLYLGGEPSTLSYLTGMDSEAHLDALRQIVASNWDSTRVVKVTEGDHLPYIQFSPDRQMMAFSVSYHIPEDDLGRGLPLPDIMVINENGNLIAEPITGYFRDWLPDGEGIILVPGDGLEFYFFDGRPPSYSDCGNELHYLTISPDGNTIFCIALSSAEGTEVWHMDHDGSNLSLIFTSPGLNASYHPSWSPDSNQLVLPIGNRIWLLEPSSGTVNSFDISEPQSGAANSFPMNGRPIWSSDNQRLVVYMRTTALNNEDVIYLIDLMNEQVTELGVSFPPRSITGRYYTYLTDFTWSPDGKWLAFLLRHRPLNGFTSPSEDIWLIDLASTTLIRLTDDGLQKAELRWWP